VIDDDAFNQPIWGVVTPELSKLSGVKPPISVKDCSKFGLIEAAPRATGKVLSDIISEKSAGSIDHCER
jgi:hypothetical protein